MKKLFTKNTLRLLSSIALGTVLLGMVAQTASAAILFQDDTFATIESDAIMIGSNDAGVRNTAVQFGNDPTASENGIINWNISTNRFSVDHPVDVTGGLTSNNAVDIGGTNGLTGNSPASSRNVLRKDSAPNTNAACSALGEVIVNTTTNRMEVCTTTGAAGAAIWSAPTTTIPSGLTNPLTCSVSDLFYNTTTNQLEVCTATNVFTVAGPQNFEDIYAYDADKTLTTGGGNFTIAAGAGTVNLNETTLNTTSTGATTLNAGAASSTAIDLNASNAAGGITGTWGTGGLNFSGPGSALDFSSTGALTQNATGNSTINVTSGNLNLQTTTSGNVALTATGAGNSVTFADANVTTPIKFSNTATALNATFPAGAGILDALNSFTSTAAGSGASNVGVASGLTNITGSDVQAALASIDSQIGSNAKKVDTLTFNPQYPNYVISRSGANNQGTLIDDFDSTNKVQYYGWTSNQATLQNMDVRFRFPLPTDFKSLSTANGDSFTFNFRTGLNASTHNKLDFTVRDVTKANTTCGSSLTNFSGTANTWTSVAISAATLNAGCSGGNALAAGDVIAGDVTFYADNTANAAAQVGQTNLTYTN